MLNELGITRGGMLRYMLLPQILPRAKSLLGSGFFGLPYFMVVVFNTLKIIPDGHPYLWRENHGRYSTIQAIAAAANHISFDRKNIDKLFIFGVILSGIVMIFLQIALMVTALFAAPAFAYNGPGLGPRTLDAFVRHPGGDPTQDIAFRMLDMVFGVTQGSNAAGPYLGFFGTNELSAGGSSFHAGFHALLQFYSFGMLLVGSFIIIYLVTAIVLETARWGVPFGQRFNKAWAPVRLIMFFGLLLPAQSGLNVAQYVLLSAAKYGSNVATNAWLTFDRATQAPYIGTAQQLVARPNAPNLQSLVTFMSLAKTCAWAEGRTAGRDIKAYLSYGTSRNSQGEVNFTELTSSINFAEVARRAKGGAISIRFGIQDDNLYREEAGAVFPYCGELTMTIVDQAQPGAALLQQSYIEAVNCLWSGQGGQNFQCPQTNLDNQGRDFTARFSAVPPHNPFPDIQQYIGPTQRQTLLTNINKAFDDAIGKAVEKQASEGKWNNDVSIDMGWAAAGIWFNKVAEQNGALTSAVNATPDIRRMPYAMEFVKNQKMREESRTPVEEAYMPYLNSGKMINFETPQQREVAMILGQQFKYWGTEYTMGFMQDVAETGEQDTTGNVIIDTINMMMGTKGLFDMCRNTDIHPLAQMASLGKGLVDHSIRSFGMAAGVGVSAGLLTIMQKQTFAQTLHGATKFFMTFASIGLVLGFVLYYVLPMMPFIYFFFAVMTWVKSIFEAMVGMPLWALAHLRIDGQGMPGDAAASGYFYILEIFIRPVCILIGFLGSIVIFAAMVKVLNQIFYLVIANLAGHEVTTSTTGCFTVPGVGATGDVPTEPEYKRSVIDEFFFSVIYTIIVYMIGMSCFKLVDLIPDRITRWLGSGVQSFGSMDGDPARDMMLYVSTGAGMTGRQLKEGVKGFGFFS